jgi:hypothetical protein
LANQVSVLTTEITGATSAELERFRTAWQEGHRDEARAWIKSLTASHATLSAMSPAVAAQVLRFAAGMVLDEEDDLVQVKAWLDEARSLDPESDDLRLRAVLLSREGDRDGALALLANSPKASSQTLRAALLLEAGDIGEAEKLLDKVDTTDGE